MYECKTYAVNQAKWKAAVEFCEDRRIHPKQSQKTNSNQMNRIEPEKQDIQSEKNLDDRMELIMYALNDTVAPIPEEGNICTFKYYAKTPNISYDQHPLVAVTEYFSGGFVESTFTSGSIDNTPGEN